MNARMIRSTMLAVVWLQFTTGSLLAQVASEATDPLSVAAEPPLGPREAGSEGVLITWSEKNDELRGFSTKLGDWEVVPIAPQEKITVIVEGNVAAVRFGDSVAAFSGEKGWWDVIELSKDSQAVPTCHPSLVVIEDNGHLYTFAAEKGRWTSPTDPGLKPVTKKIETSPSTVQIVASNMQEWIDSLPRHKERGITLQYSPAGNRTIYLDRRNLLAEVEKHLDEVVQRALLQTDSGNSPQTFPTPQNQDEQIAKMRAELTELEKTTKPAGSRESSSPATDVNRGKEAEGLLSQVTQAFDVRQQLQQLEAQKLRLKLQKIEANLEAREKNRDQIIKRRVEELLDPNSNTDDWNLRTNPKHALESQPIASSPSAEPGPHPENGNAVSIPPGPRGSDTGNASFLASSSSAAAAMELPPPSEVLKTLRNLRRLFTGHVEEQKRLQGFIDRRSRPMTELIAEGVVKEGEENDIAGTLLGLRESLSNVERGQKDWARDWRQAWSEYQSDLRLLQLDVEESQVALAEQGSELERAKQDFEAGIISTSTFQQAVTKHRIAEFQLKRTAEILRLYADIEKNEPELNPDFKPEAEPTPEPK